MSIADDARHSYWAGDLFVLMYREPKNRSYWRWCVQEPGGRGAPFARGEAVLITNDFGELVQPPTWLTQHLQ